MRTTNKLSAAIFVALLTLTTLPLMARGNEPPATDITARFADGGFSIDGFRALEVGGIVVLRGKTFDPAEVTRVADYARTLGYQRVANVVSLAEAPDDPAIERRAERALSNRRLDGCTFRIESQQGVVHVGGHVQFEMQKDVVASLIRGIDGVRDVKVDLER
ncbi:MAG TPA: BON domain-containing protein [Thermoanaerobaculia bacterium]|jgi:osmotically-inducible protein OsmY